ncbi:MAG TPA: hypothetical protein VEW46_13980, partial [Pyrinomonadaceae bacterium]|nr:hypothetical protein [Pyrinomonadaceae bacterium]
FKTFQEILRNSEGVALLAFGEWRRNSFRVASSKNECLFPRVAKAQPWLELANAFSVIHSYLQFSHTLGSDRAGDRIKADSLNLFCQDISYPAVAGRSRRLSRLPGCGTPFCSPF